MAAFQDNLLVRLHKWASRQDENFLTETFAHLLWHLKEQEPTAAANVIRQLTKGVIDLPSETVGYVQISTQVHGEEGIPDLELRTDHHFVIIEVKSRAPVREEQIRHYHEKLEKSTNESKRLVLLTRYPISIDGDFLHVRWFQVAEWIEQESQKNGFRSESSFLVKQFLGFLKARNMTMEKVTWHFAEGILSFQNLLDMLEEIANGSKLHPEFVMPSSREYVGYFLDGKKYWWGLRFDNPNELTFNTNRNFRIDAEKARLIAKGKALAGTWHVDKCYWEYSVSLDSEETFFFARTKASQIARLTSFLDECLVLAKQIEKPVAISTVS